MAAHEILALTDLADAPVEDDDALLDGLPHRRGLLGTWPDDRPARRLYVRAGWRDLARIDDDSTLMGIELDD
jgi:hypothetical protein